LKTYSEFEYLLSIRRKADLIIDRLGNDNEGGARSFGDKTLFMIRHLSGDLSIVTHKDCHQLFHCTTTHETGLSARHLVTMTRYGTAWWAGHLDELARQARQKKGVKS